MIDKQRIQQRTRYLRPLLIPFILYICLLALAVNWAPKIENTLYSYIVALLPMIPGLFLAYGIVKITSKFDEMERRILLEAVAFSFIFTLILLLSFGLLGLVGVPQPDSIFIALLMIILLAFGKLRGNWRYH
jgi:hypothetical protein